MDLKVCSRQVHDGYATIRSRGRNRPRPITDSEENLLADSGGGCPGGNGGNGVCSYTLGSCIKISGRNFTDDDVHRTSLDQRWINNGKTIVETYGTLRASSRKNDTRNTNQTTLKTFRQTLTNQNNGGVRKEPRNVRRSRSCVIVDDKRSNFKNNHNDLIDNVEDKINRDSRNEVERTLKSFTPIDDRSSRRVIIRQNGLTRSKMVQSGTKKSVPGIVRDERMKKSESRLTRSEFDGVGNLIVDKNIGGSEPIYALPNNASSSRSRRDRRAVVVDGNYVQSGDLYRTTVKYIEDVNKNIAEIDNNFKRSDKSINSSYGIINKINKDETICLSDDFCGYLRNRGVMVPMPPISPNFGEHLSDNIDDNKNDNNEPLMCNRKIDTTKSLRHLSTSGTRRKLPPNPSIRSSSLSSTSRHSTGSTTTSSTKSTDSLHAIDESINEKTYHLLRERDPGESISVSASVLDGIESKDDSTDDDRSFVITQRQKPCQNTLLLDANNLEKTRHDYNSLNGRINFSNLYAKSDDVLLPINLNNNNNNKYGTLPYRRTKERTTGRSLHKSTEDVLDRTSREKIEPSFRACSSSIDVSDNSTFTKDFIYPIEDATDVILKGQLERSRLNLSIGDTFPTTSTTTTTTTTTTIFGFNNNRTRHDSFKSDTNNDDYGKYFQTLFATLPRRGNVSNRDQVSNDSPRRLSGNVTLLEPLYEHAVSDPVKPRSTDNVIPWWELATRKYRHRSCPSLQVNEKTRRTHLLAGLMKAESSESSNSILKTGPETFGKNLDADDRSKTNGGA
ncbi:hypothetical protein M0802_001527 [Mischocyttarus mexicanus]|nr:hypothetical protein M0802_001527 [Mischocyttarus mexicanus]